MNQTSLVKYSKQESSRKELFIIDVCFISGDPESSVHGMVTHDGLFEGHITSSSDYYIVERASRYFNQSQPFHSVIYRKDDVIKVETDPPCRSDDIHRKLRHRQHKSFDSSSSSKSTSSKSTLYKSTSSSNPFYTNRTRNRRDVVSSWQQAYEPDNYRSEEIRHSYLHQPRRKTIDPSRTTCTLYMQADHLFYKKFHNNIELVIEQLTQHVQGVNDIYNRIGKI